MSDLFRWGILGTGGIARKFATGLAALPDAQLVAVGSRSQESADQFGDQFNIPRRHASYEALAADPEIDAIYISTPHPFHAENSLLCLENGKAVLCEKPFTINVGETDQVIEVARESGIFLMEAMWTRFLPAIVRLRDLLAEGAIGEPRWMQSDFGFRGAFKPEGRWLNLELGGGALLDVGIYPISFASMVFGAPSEIVSTAHIGETGVDEQSSYMFAYDGGQIALGSSAVRTETPQEAVICGTEGMIKIPYPWWNANELILMRSGAEPETIAPPREGNGYNYEAAEVARCVRAGELESPVMPLDETRAIMQVLDTLRGQWGLQYPGE
jgi:predicted dehydrogenase